MQLLAYRSEAALYQDDTIPPLTETAVEIRSAIRHHLVLKAEIDGQLIGAVRVRTEGSTGYVGRLIVHPAYQNRGIGTALLLAAEHHTPAVTRYELFTGHRSVRNLHLYEKLGYRRTHTEPVHARLTLVYLVKERG